jgi:glycosyltransferase involved in cell wall biosynthesis
LDRLLGGIAALEFEEIEPVLRVVVVDNAPGPKSETLEIANRWRGSLSDLVVEEETQQGISFARNSGLDAAGEVDFVVFIDDDEVPSRAWLDQLLRVQRELDADVVRGPVIPRFENRPDDWIVAGGFFEGRRYATGEELHVAYTHNTLLRWPPYRELRFSPRYARSGGEDSHFFGRVHQAGAKMVWADEAEVYEYHPPERQTLSWLLKRQYRIGLTRAIIDAELGLNANPRRRSAWEAANRLWRGGWRALRGAHQKDERVHGLLQVAAGVGRIAGIAGLSIEVYQ